MEHKQSDEFLRGLINDLDSVPPQVNWQKERGWYILEEKLHPVHTPKAGLQWYYAIAASVLLVMSISLAAYKYIYMQDKQIAQLKQKLDERRIRAHKPVIQKGISASEGLQLHESLLPVDSKPEKRPVLQKTVSQEKYTVRKRQQPEDHSPTIAGNDSTGVVIPEWVLEGEGEEKNEPFIAAEEKPVLQPKTAQEIMLGKVKKQPAAAGRKPIIIVFTDDQEEYIARQPAEPSQKIERKMKLHHVIINNSPESESATSAPTGADVYPRINKQ